MESIRMLENPRKCMQRVGFLKWLVFDCAKRATSNLSILGNNLITAISQKITVPLNPDLNSYIKSALTSPAHREIFTKVKKQNSKEMLESINIELQDAYLSSSNLASLRGRLAKDEWFEYPSFAIGLALIKKGTYSLSIRGFSFLSLVTQEERQAFTQYRPEFNPLRISIAQKLLLAFSLVENDGQLLTYLYKRLPSKDVVFSDIEASELLPEILEKIIKESRLRVRSGDDLQRIQKIEKTNEFLKRDKGKPSIGGSGVRHETIAVRLEPFVDLGLLSKPNQFDYRYKVNDATKAFFDPLINSENIDHFLNHSFFQEANKALNLNGEHRTDRGMVMPVIQKAYNVVKSPLGYAPILEVSLLAGIYAITEAKSYFELSEALDTLKSLQKERTDLVRFNVDRWGALAFVKFNNDIMKAIEG
jgi:hypothetical protein